MAADAAPWWNADNPQDGKPLVRHAPSLHHYHNPDQRQLERMRSGIGTPVIVPKATSDGASPAFNAHEAGVVHVDPDAPDGGVIVDLTNLDRRSMRAALAQSAYPHQVFYRLGVSPSVVGKGFGRTTVGAEPARQNPLMPNDYVVPKAAQDGTQHGDQTGYYAHTPGYGPVAPTLVNGYSPPLPTPAYQAAQEMPQMFPPVPQLPPQPQGNQQQPLGPAPAPPQVQQYAPQPQYQPPPQPQYQQPQPQYAPPPQAYPYPPAPAQLDPALMAMMAQMDRTMSGLAAGLGAVTQKVAELGAAPPRPVGMAQTAQSVAARARTRPAEDNPYRQDAGPTFDDTAMRPIPRSRQGDEEGVGAGRRREEPEQRQTLADLRSDDEPRDGIIVGFESLKLPYVLGPRGVKPRRQVFFELPQVGNHAVRYHDVIVGKNNLTLVYDTRYEDGDMYVPPEMGDAEISVHAPYLKKTFKVSSVGLTFAMGVFDLVVLPKHGEEALDMGEGG